MYFQKLSLLKTFKSFSVFCNGLCLKAWTAAKTNLAQVPLMGGQTLNLPMDGFSLEADSVDDLQLKQLEELTRNLQQSVANIKASRGKEN